MISAGANGTRPVRGAALIAVLVVDEFVELYFRFLANTTIK